jgi:hypothetical protein
MKTFILQPAGKLASFAVANRDEHHDGFVDFAGARIVLEPRAVIFIDQPTDAAFERVETSDGIEIDPMNGTVDISDPERPRRSELQR